MASDKKINLLERRLMISFLFIFTGITQSIYSQEVVKLSSHHLYDPSDFKIIDHKKAVVIDNTYREAPVYMYDLEAGEILNSITLGQGPSELSDKYKLISFLEDGNKIMIWDYGLNLAKIYTKDLEYVDVLRGNIFKNRLYQVGALTDTTLFYSDGNETLVNFTFLDNNLVEDEFHYSLPLAEESALLPLENNLLKQGMFFTNQGGNLFIAFEYSSMVLSLGADGLNFSDNEPDAYAFPVSEDQQYSLPDLAEFPVCALDIDMDENYLYVLYKGKKASKSQLLKYATNYEPLVEILYHSDTVLLFDKQTGKFIKTLTLPVQSRKIEIHQGSVYMLSTIHDDLAGIYLVELEI